MRIIFLLLAFFSQIVFSANLTIKAKKGVDATRVVGCVLNVQTNGTTCIRSSIASEDTGEFNADGTPILKDVVQGIFSFDLPAGRYLPYIKVVPRQGITYSSQRAFSSSSILLSSSSNISIPIYAAVGLSITSVCDNFNGTYTIKGSGFSDSKNIVATSGVELSNSDLPVWTNSLIVVAPRAGYPILPLTVVSKINGASAVYNIAAGESLPYCVFQ